MFFPHVLVLPPGATPPVFVLFRFLLVVGGLVLTSGRASGLTRGAISEKRKKKNVRDLLFKKLRAAIYTEEFVTRFKQQFLGRITEIDLSVTGIFTQSEQSSCDTSIHHVKQLS